MAEEPSGDRTEAASAKRLSQAREEGNVPISRDLVTLAGLSAATLVLMMSGPSLAQGLALQLRQLLAHPDAFTADGGTMFVAVLAGLRSAAPLILAVLLAGIGAVLLQTGFLFNLAALMPDPGRLDPRRGISRLFGVDHLMETGKALVKAGFLGFGTWRVLATDPHALLAATQWPPTMLAEQIMRQILHVLTWMLAIQAMITLLDMLWVRLRHASKLKMSREELRQEHKDSDGNPQIKARLRQLRRARMRKRMMAAVPKATLIITNPTHYAVALSYGRGQGGAPVVVAKGMDEVAARIRELATEHRVPIIANPPLARALYTVELDAEIPTEHFQAVAELIAYVWGLRSRARPLVG
jgi:flagellar biosynthetic protein FlhB